MTSKQSQHHCNTSNTINDELIINPAKTQLIIFKAVGKRIPNDFHLIQGNNCSINPQTIQSNY